MCYDNSCRNRLTEIECSSSCGEGCQNRRITEKKGLKTELFMTKYKGRGIKASEPIKKGDFIMEYTGEVIRDQTYRNRMKKVYAKDQHYYTCHLKSKLVLDAHRFGNNCKIAFSVHALYTCKPIADHFTIQTSEACVHTTSKKVSLLALCKSSPKILNITAQSCRGACNGDH